MVIENAPPFHHGDQKVEHFLKLKQNMRTKF